VITIVSCSHYPDDERIYHKEIKSLAANNYKINYFTLSDSESNLSGDKINHINYRKSEYSINDYIKSIEIELKEISTEVIHIHEPELFSLAVNVKKIFGAKIIYDVHEDYISMIYTFSRWNSFIKYLKSKYWVFRERRFLTYVDEIIIASPAIVNSDFKSQGFDPVLLENFPLYKYVKKIDFSSKQKNSLIYHGNFGPERGITELVKAMPAVIKKIPDITLSLYGGFRTKKYESDLNQLIDYLKLRNHVHLMAHLPHNDIWGHLEKHKVGVIPFNDNPLTQINIPTKLFEFMAAGCQLVMPKLSPIMKYDIQGAKYFNSGDINGLSNAIIEGIIDIDEKSIQYNQNNIISNYNWDKNQYKLIDLYNRVLS
jgi:glycosyltransferase involved in cell wall biosynthesis